MRLTILIFKIKQELETGNSVGYQTWEGTGRERNVGVLSQVATCTQTDNFNFFSEGTAPNFPRHHVGGSTSRNTFELWKSTLPMNN